MTERLLTDAEWREKLMPEDYNIFRCGGTEAPFTGQYVDCKEKGIYQCRCCAADLFDSETKYDSGSGWPSFFDVLSAEAVREIADDSLNVRRIEVTCRACDAHLGHVFQDGPQPTGLRYCINSASLNLKSQ